MNTIHIIAETAGEAWIAALKKVFFEGNVIRTEYDRDDLEPSRDFTSLIEVTNPLPAGKKLPSLHRGDLYGVMSVRGGYIKEVLDGINDSKIWESDTSFPYTYHDRIFAYRPYNAEDAGVKNHTLTLRRSEQVEGIDISDLEFPSIDQVNYIVEKLKEAPYSRRAQGITWRPLSDPYREDCPCLQRVWARVIDGKLHLQTAWRSRDLFKAWGANVSGMIMLQQQIASALGLPLGSYVDFCNSLHCYGSKKVMGEIVRLFETMEKRGELEEHYLPKFQELKKLYAS